MREGLVIRPATAADQDGIWRILEPVIRAGETYPLPRSWSRDEGLRYWFSPGHEVFLAEAEGRIVGTYYMRPNQSGGGAHVCNCGYMVLTGETGRGVARAMCEHSLKHARENGYRIMQFNFVIATNERAVRLWTSLGFDTIGRLPSVYEHPRLGEVDALVMLRRLQ